MLKNQPVVQIRTLDRKSFEELALRVVHSLEDYNHTCSSNDNDFSLSNSFSYWDHKNQTFFSHAVDMDFLTALQFLPIGDDLEKPINICVSSFKDLIASREGRRAYNQFADMEQASEAQYIEKEPRGPLELNQNIDNAAYFIRSLGLYTLLTTEDTSLSDTVRRNRLKWEKRMNDMIEKSLEAYKDHLGSPEFQGLWGIPEKELNIASAVPK